MDGGEHNFLVALAGTISAACCVLAAITLLLLVAATPVHCRCGFTRAIASSVHPPPPCELLVVYTAPPHADTERHNPNTCRAPYIQMAWRLLL